MLLLYRLQHLASSNLRLAEPSAYALTKVKRRLFPKTHGLGGAGVIPMRNAYMPWRRGRYIERTNERLASPLSLRRKKSGHEGSRWPGPRLQEVPPGIPLEFCKALREGSSLCLLRLMVVQSAQLRGDMGNCWAFHLGVIMRQALVALFVCLSPALGFGQVPFPQLPQPVTSFSFEDKDWGIATTTTPKSAPYHAPTPTSLPSARVIKTLELKALLESNNNVVVVDVLDSKERMSVPGAFWMPGAGYGQLVAAEKSRFSTALEKLTDGDKNRPLAFLCLNSECWLSYNASLHALEAGYKDVIWYRGGTDAWNGASLERKKPERISW
jgi:PQQ-dependent catabolism-associated CXXCW motif protein